MSIEFWAAWYVGWGWIFVLGMPTATLVLALSFVSANGRTPLEPSPNSAVLFAAEVVAPPLAAVVAIALMIVPVALPATKESAVAAFGPSIGGIYVFYKAAFAGLAGLIMTAAGVLAAARRWTPVEASRPHKIRIWRGATRAAAAFWLLALVGALALSLYFRLTPWTWFQIMTRMGQSLAAV